MGRGPRVQCPFVAPIMCAYKKCDKGMDHCCEVDCGTVGSEPFGGPRLCYEPNAQATATTTATTAAAASATTTTATETASAPEAPLTPGEKATTTAARWKPQQKVTTSKPYADGWSDEYMVNDKDLEVWNQVVDKAPRFGDVELGALGALISVKKKVERTIFTFQSATIWYRFRFLHYTSVEVRTQRENQREHLEVTSLKTFP